MYFRKGIVKARPKRKLSGKDLEDIVGEERKVISDFGGYSSFVIPFSCPALPKGYKRSFWTGLPRSPRRYDKVLHPGMYFFIPFIDKLVMDYKQERVLNLGYISTPTSDSNSDSRVVAVSCNIRYELMDLYRAYTAIHDYEASLRDHTLSILAKHCRGKSYDDWKSPEVVKQVETSVLEELREVVTGKWGLHIHNVYITDNIACGMQRLVHEGTAVSIKNEIKQEEPSLI